MSLILLAFFALIVLPALDYRFTWSPVAPSVSILGDVVILLSFLFIFWVTRVNSFAASNIQVEQDQSVIDGGPYAYVRHPMYAGAAWLFVGLQLSHASLSTLGLIVPFMSVLLWRLLDEGEFCGGLAQKYGICATGALSPDSVRVVEQARASNEPTIFQCVMASPAAQSIVQFVAMAVLGWQSSDTQVDTADLSWTDRT